MATDVKNHSEPPMLHLDTNYKKFLTEIKEKVRVSRLQAALAINREVIHLYWHIGNKIKELQAKTNWGDKLLNSISHDLQNSFPETRGFSYRNIAFMRQFASEYPNEVMKQLVSQLPWGHIILLIQRVKNIRSWYITQTIQNSWSRFTLERHLKNDLYAAQAIDEGKSSNFLEKLPKPQSELAQDLLKSPYNFDFMGLHDDAYERDIEHGSFKHITNFLLELGRGFAFVGNQVPILIGDEDFFIDILLYNVKLRCYTIVEFKSTKFKPEHIGQLNFYLGAVDNTMRHPDDNPSIGLLLCKSRNKIVAKYALENVTKPIGVSEYQLTKSLPDKLQGIMPTIKEIEDELRKNDTITNDDDMNSSKKSWCY